MKIKSVALTFLSWLKRQSDIIAFVLIAIAIILPSITPLSSDGKLNPNGDFYLYASTHEAVRKAILEYHTFPLRSFWFGGGYPTLGDPNDPTLNPLTLITLIFGAVMGLKIIVFLAMLIGGLSTYALARYILGYTKWGALFSGLIFGLSIVLPRWILDGNYTEVYSAFLPLCLLLIGLACRGRKIAILILSFIFYIMLSDGKQTALMSIFYIGILCILDVIPMSDIFGKSHFSLRPFDSSNRHNTNIKPLKVLILALIVTFFVGMIRFLPAFELITSHGGLGHMDIFNHPQRYIQGEGIYAYPFQKLWREAICWQGVYGLVTVGWLPVLLSLSVFCIFPRKAFSWGVSLFFFGWLAIAYDAPVDLFKFLWHMPIFNAINKPYKYFSFQVVFTFAIVAGQFFWLLAKMRPKWLEHVIAVVLIILGVLVLYPGVNYIQKETYTFNMPAELLVKQNEFYNIQGKDIERFRIEPLNSLTYTNLIRGVGTIDINTAFIIAENAVPKYFVDAKGRFIANRNYRGEAYFTDSKNLAKVKFEPNAIITQVNLYKPDTLIINQNYHRDWHSDHGKIFNQNGLIALQLDDTGIYKITMRYISRSFYFGLLISLLSLATVILVCWSYKTGRLVNWSNNTPIVVRWIPKSIIWLIGR